jgi:predicted lactoylglutathione lyase
VKQRVNLITLGVGDLGRARRFYEGLGWSTGAAPEDDVVSNDRRARIPRKNLLALS